MTTHRDRWRRRLAEYIANHEHLSGDELRAALGWRMLQFSDAVYGWPDRWFMLTIRGWELTKQGADSLGRHTPQMEMALAHAAKVGKELDAWIAEHARPPSAPRLPVPAGHAAQVNTAAEPPTPRLTAD